MLATSAAIRDTGRARSGLCGPTTCGSRILEGWQAPYDATVTVRLRAAGMPILCKTNTTPGVVARIQTALDKAGHNPGPIDGVIGAQTMTAVTSYQKAKGLPTGGITIGTLKSLGVMH